MVAQAIFAVFLFAAAQMMPGISSLFSGLSKRGGEGGGTPAQQQFGGGYGGLSGSPTAPLSKSSSLLSMLGGQGRGRAGSMGGLSRILGMMGGGGPMGRMRGFGAMSQQMMRLALCKESEGFKKVCFPSVPFMCQSISLRQYKLPNLLQCVPGFGCCFKDARSYGMGTTMA